MSWLAVLLALFAPAGLAAACLAVVSPRPRALHDWVWLCSCGALLGVLVVGAAVPRLGPAPQSAFSMLIGPLLLAAAGAWALAVRRWRRERGHEPLPARAARLEPSVRRWHGVLWALLAVQGLLIIHQALGSPTVPWDAWTTWMARAQAWFQLNEFRPPVDFAEWLAAPAHTLPVHAPEYPDAVAGIAVWMASAAGAWHTAAVHAAWPLAWLATLGALWSGLMRLQLGASLALAASFVFASLPMLSAHAALAGYADLWICALVLVAALAMMHGCSGEARAGSWALAAACLLLMPLIKREGLVWMLVLALACGYAGLPVHFRRWVFGAAAVAIGLAVFVLPFWPLRLDLPVLGALVIGGGQLQIGSWLNTPISPYPVLPELVWTLFVLPHWNLFWFFLPLLLIAGRWAPAAAADGARAQRLLWSASLIGLVFLVLLFGFTDNARWVQNLTSINRILLQWLPLPLLAVAWQWRGWRSRGLNADAEELVGA
jgi:hypothetical protein